MKFCGEERTGSTVGGAKKIVFDSLLDMFQLEIFLTANIFSLQSSNVICTSPGIEVYVEKLKIVMTLLQFSSS